MRAMVLMVPAMQTFFRAVSLFLVVLFASCASNTRTPFSPESGPPTVGMPGALSERERLFVPDLERALRDQGLVPVRDGAGDMQLEFVMDAGPINTDTRITLTEKRRTLAQGKGRASGLPMIGRSRVAENSFSRAFEEFQSQLSDSSNRRGWASASDSRNDIY
jgi:hypothetical protein